MKCKFVLRIIFINDKALLFLFDSQMRVYEKDKIGARGHVIAHGAITFSIPCEGNNKRQAGIEVSVEDVGWGIST